MTQKPSTMIVAGVMSGTSADGVDVALVRIAPGPRLKVIGHIGFRYPKALREAVLRVAGGSAVTAEEISRLHWKLGKLYADCVERACTKASVALRKNDAKVTTEFIFNNIITRFGCPLELVSDRGTHFLNSTITTLTNSYLIKHRAITPYNPKANGLTERANGLLCKILTKIVSSHKIDWDTKLASVLWAYRTIEKITTKKTPFYMTYGMDSKVPIEFDIPTHRILVEERLSVEASQEQRLVDLERLEEDRLLALRETARQQDKRKATYDKKLKKKDIKDNDWVMLYDSRFTKFPGKLHTRWLGPYKVIKVWENGSLSLKDMDGILLPTRVNGSRVKKYFFPPN